jgi:two-component system response regulator GlrR
MARERPPTAAPAAGPPDGSTLGDSGVDAARGAGWCDRFRLRVVEGPDAGKELTTEGSRTVVGTHPSADFSLSDPLVSRFHAELVVGEAGLLVRDLGSRNGTRLEGVRVVEAYARDGATLALGRSRVRLELAKGRARLELSGRTSFGVMTGRSAAMRETFARLERAAASDATVLLEGETGTGKEAAAESIHRESGRAAGPFVVIDCAAVPAELLESELFGHERGSFTGAVAARRGAFEEADGGTVFLDEIGELPAALQPKLLRVLERREVRRLGSNRYASIDVRIVAATNRSLRHEVNAKHFRADLYYRLAVLEVRLPPLRERPDDLAPLVEALLERLGAAGRPEAEFVRSAAFLEAAARHPWPGNVRELRNHVERCLALGADTAFRTRELEATAAAGAGVDLSRSLREVREACASAAEAHYLAAVLDRHGDNVSAAARAAGVDRIHFHRLLRRHGLR